MVRAVPNPSKVYVGNLPSDLHKDDLKRALGKYGNLRKVWLAHNPPGFAFVDFYNAREARVCVRELNGRRLFGCTLRVELSTGTEPPKTYQSRRSPESWRNGSLSPYDCGRDSVSPPQYDRDDDSTASSSHHSEFDPSTTRLAYQDIHLQQTVKKMAENLLYLVSQCHNCQVDMNRLYADDRMDVSGDDFDRSYTERLALIAKGRGSPSSRRAMCNQVDCAEDKRQTRIRQRPVVRSLVHKANSRSHRSSR